EREAREVERGGRVEQPPTPTPTPVPSETRQQSEAPAKTAARSAPVPFPAPQASPRPPGRSAWLVPALAGFVVLAAVGGWLLRPQPAPTIVAPAPTTTAPVASGPDPEELQERIRALVAQRTEDVAAGLKEQQEAEIKALQQEL